MDKKSFIMYGTDWQVLADLPNEELGVVMRQVFDYACNGIEPEKPHLAFKFMRVHLDADIEKYEERCEKNQINGKKGGRPKKTQQNPTKPNGFFGNPTEPKKPDNDNDNDNDIDNDNVTDIDTDTKNVKKKNTKKNNVYAVREDMAEGERKFCESMPVTFPRICSMKEPLTYEQLGDLREDYDNADISAIMFEMENWADLTKKNISAYRTIRNWLNRRRK